MPKCISAIREASPPTTIEEDEKYLEYLLEKPDKEVEQYREETLDIVARRLIGKMKLEGGRQ